MKNELIFLGTSHIDPSGYERLQAVLQEIGPQIIILEISRFAIIFRKTLGTLYQRILIKRVKRYNLEINTEIENAISFFDIPYEYRAARRYAQAQGARVILADVSLFSFLRLSRSYQFIRRKNILSLSGLHGDRFTSERRIAERIFSRADPLMIRIRANGFEGDRLIELREKILTRRIHRIVSRYRNRKIACIGGWEHLIDDPDKRTLYSNYNLPKRRMIIFLN
jgi:hypothetical protein